MKYLIYLSTAVHLFDDQAIIALLEKSRQRNSANNVTGVLLYHEGNFIQLLEGEADAVDSTLERISKDATHKNIIVIAEGEQDHRSFGDWSMGFQRGTAKEFGELEAYIDPKKIDSLTGTHESPALNMLKTFVKTNLG